MWSYRYATDFGGVYTSNKCLDKGLFNHCNYKPSVEIQRLLLESDCVDNPTEYKGVARCTYGVPNSLNLTHFFNGRAQWLENIAATERQWAQQNRDGAAAAEIRANTLHQHALAAKALAEQTYARAKNEYAILKQIVDKITDYRNASAELQQAIAAHHSDDSEILLWAATRYDAAGRLQGEVAGNGLLTRREYDPYSGQLHRITTGIEESKILPLIRDLTYTYDGADNVLTRGDAIIRFIRPPLRQQGV